MYGMHVSFKFTSPFLCESVDLGQSFPLRGCQQGPLLAASPDRKGLAVDPIMQQILGGCTNLAIFFTDLNIFGHLLCRTLT